MQQVQQELRMQASPCLDHSQQQQRQQRQQQHLELGADKNDEGEGIYASSSCCGCLPSSMHGHGAAATAMQHQQQPQQSYSILRTGGGYQPGLKHAAAESAEGLLRCAALHGQLLAATAATGSSSCTAKLIASLPKEVVAIMRDFYRQHCCVECPLANAARCVSGAAGAGAPQPAAQAGSPVKAAAAWAGGDADVLLQPLLAWHVLEGLLVLLNRAFLQRERSRLQQLKARCDKQLAAAQRRAAAAASLPQVLQQSQAQHLKGQLQAARQALAAREKGQAAAVLKVAERGYHMGRQVDEQAAQLRHQEAQAAAAAACSVGLRARLQEAQQQQAALLQRVSDAFVSGAQWQSCQAAEWLQQLLAAVQDAEDTLAEAAVQAADTCWSGVCSGVQLLSREAQQVAARSRDFVAAALDEVGAAASGAAADETCHSECE
ncbi:hypothetical protein COO60DRAFT_231431 [Scenedesmus sp. NREL 46B-D3]|nr:hypothetical protein COO60DRAFT_231431 [Scenedesmus sp. NREL 46B-D3]